MATQITSLYRATFDCTLLIGFMILVLELLYYMLYIMYTCNLCSRIIILYTRVCVYICTHIQNHYIIYVYMYILMILEQIMCLYVLF